MEAFGSYSELTNQGIDLAQIKVVGIQNEPDANDEEVVNEDDGIKMPVSNQETTVRQRRGEKSNSSNLSPKKVY